MATLLLIVIYIAYIGLGIPDSLFGTAWPAMYEEFGIPVWLAGCITPIFTLFTVFSSVTSTRLINKFGTGRVAAVSTALTAVGLLGNSIAPNIVWILLFSIPLGFGAGAVDAGLNNYVAVHYNAMHMSFLHCFYGIGVSISPYLMSLALRNNDWHAGYRNAGIIQIFITAAVCLSLPLWSRVKHNYNVLDDGQGGEFKPKTVSMIHLAKNPAIRMTWLCFFASCTVEHISGTWGSTFLVESKGVTAETAARIVMFYYIGLTLGRLFSGLLAIRFTSWKIMSIGFCVLGGAMILLILPLPPVFACIGLFLIGLGNGPMYPNLMHLTPINFGADISQSVIGSQMAAAYVGIMCMPGIFGLIVKAAGTDSFVWFNTVMYVLFVVSFVELIRLIKKNKK